MKNASFVMSVISIFLWIVTILIEISISQDYELYSKVCVASEGTPVKIPKGIACLDNKSRIRIKGLDNLD